MPTENANVKLDFNQVFEDYVQTQWDREKPEGVVSFEAYREIIYTAFSIMKRQDGEFGKPYMRRSGASMSELLSWVAYRLSNDDGQFTYNTPLYSGEELFSWMAACEDEDEETMYRGLIKVGAITPRNIQ